MDSKNKSIIKVLAFVAIAISLFAAVVGSPYKISIQPVNTKESFEIAGESVEVIDVNMLAEWIMDKRNDFFLIDSRSNKKFQEYHLPFALNIQGVNFKDALAESEKSMIIYDENERYTVDKLEMLVKNRSNQVYILKGGVVEWMDRIIFPDVRGLTLSKEEKDKIYKTSSYFGGKPTTEKERKRKKFKREGC